MRPADDDRSEPRGGAETFEIEWDDGDREPGGLVRLVIAPGEPTVALVEVRVSSTETVAVLADDLPSGGDSFEYRAPGIWLDLASLVPFDHWTVGLEAFGLAVPRGTAMTADTRGDRVAVGLDLDVDTVEPGVTETDGGFEIAVQVTGEVLVGQDAWEITRPGRRRRSWPRGASGR